MASAVKSTDCVANVVSVIARFLKSWGFTFFEEFVSLYSLKTLLMHQ